MGKDTAVTERPPWEDFQAETERPPWEDFQKETELPELYLKTPAAVAPSEAQPGSGLEEARRSTFLGRFMHPETGPASPPPNLTPQQKIEWYGQQAAKEKAKAAVAGELEKGARLPFEVVKAAVRPITEPAKGLAADIIENQAAGRMPWEDFSNTAQGIRNVGQEERTPLPAEQAWAQQGFKGAVKQGLAEGAAMLPEIMAVGAAAPAIQEPLAAEKLFAGFMGAKALAENPERPDKAVEAALTGAVVPGMSRAGGEAGKMLWQRLTGNSSPLGELAMRAVGSQSLLDTLFLAQSTPELVEAWKNDPTAFRDAVARTMAQNLAFLPLELRRTEREAISDYATRVVEDYFKSDEYRRQIDQAARTETQPDKTVPLDKAPVEPEPGRMQGRLQDAMRELTAGRTREEPEPEPQTNEKSESKPHEEKPDENWQSGWDDFVSEIKKEEEINAEYRNQLGPPTEEEQQMAAMRIAEIYNTTENMAGEVDLTLKHYVDIGIFTPEQAADIWKQIKSGVVKLQGDPNVERYLARETNEAIADAWERAKPKQILKPKEPSAPATITPAEAKELERALVENEIAKTEAIPEKPEPKRLPEPPAKPEPAIEQPGGENYGAPYNPPVKLASAKAKAEARRQFETFFTPGNIVPGYGGKFDRVLAFDWNNGDWRVTVEEVRKQPDGSWQAVEGQRTHKTPPNRGARPIVPKATGELTKPEEGAAGPKKGRRSRSAAASGSIERLVEEAYNDPDITPERAAIVREAIAKTTPEEQQRFAQALGAIERRAQSNAESAGRRARFAEPDERQLELGEPPEERLGEGFSVVDKPAAGDAVSEKPSDTSSDNKVQDSGKPNPPVPQSLKNEINKPEIVKQREPWSASAAKAQKKFLLSEIDKAIKEAPDSDPAEAREAWKKSEESRDADVIEQASYEDYKNGVVNVAEIAKKHGIPLGSTGKEIVSELRRRAEMKYLPHVTIEVPGDGVFKIINNKDALIDFKEKAKKFPTTEPIARKTSGRTAPKAAEPVGKLNQENIVKSAARFLSEDPSRELLHYIWSDNTQTVATDGRRIIVIEGGLSKSNEAELFDETGRIHTEDTAAAYPNWKAVTPKTSVAVFKDVNTERLLGVLEQAVQVFPKKTRANDVEAVKIFQNLDGSIGVETYGDSEDSYSHNVQDGSKLFTSINPYYLQDALVAMRNVGNETCDIGISLDNASAKTSTLEKPVIVFGKNAKALIMPIRFEADEAFPRPLKIKDIEGPKEQPGEKKPKSKSSKDNIEAALDRAIEATDYKPDQLMEGVTGAPVWLTKGLANATLRVARAAYQGGKALADAIEEAIGWLRQQWRHGEWTAERETAAREWLQRMTADTAGLQQANLTQAEWAEEASRLREEIRAVRAAGGEPSRELIDRWRDAEDRMWSEAANHPPRGAIADAHALPTDLGRSLDKLTAEIRGQQSDSPRLTIGQRLAAGSRAAKAVEKMVDAANWGWLKAQAAWRSLVEAWKGPQPDGDYREIVKDWFLEDTKTGLEIRQWLAEIRKQVPDPIRRQALTVWIQARGDEGRLRFEADSVPDRFAKVWNTALHLTDGEKALAQRIINEFGEKLQDGMAAGIIEAAHEGYAPQVWKVPPRLTPEQRADAPVAYPGNWAAKLDTRNPFFYYHKAFHNYFEGILAGGIPRVLDIAELVGIYHAAFHKSLTSRAAVRAMMDGLAEDGMPLVMLEGKAEKAGGERGTAYLVDPKYRGKAAVTAGGRPYVVVDHQALAGWKWLEHTPDGEVIMKGRFLVHPDHAKHLANILEDPRNSQNTIIRGMYKVGTPLLKLNAYLKHSKLALGTFHLVTEGEHAIFHQVNPFKLEEIDLRDPVQADLVRAGLDLGMTETWALFTEGVGAHGGLFGSIPGLGEMSVGFSNWLFQDYIPRLKMKMARHALERNMERYSVFGKGSLDSKLFGQEKLTERQIYELTAMQANAAFGSLNYRLMGRNPVLMDIMRLALLAPDFLEARARFVGQAFTRYGGEQRRALLLMAGSVYVAARILNWILDDNPHLEPENAFYVLSGGHKYSLRTVIQDAAHLVSDWKNFMSARLSPLFRITIEGASDRDWRGIRRTTLEQLQDAGLWLAPIGTEGLVPGAATRQVTPAEAVGTMVGVMNRRYTHVSQMRDLAADFNRHADPEARSYQKRWDTESHAESKYRTLDNYLEAGEFDKAAKEFNRLIAEGSREDIITQRYRSNVLRPFTGKLEREERFLATLTPKQKSTYAKAIQERKDLFERYKAMRQRMGAKPEDLLPKSERPGTKPPAPAYRY